jgi:hypothetical protein
MGVNILDPGSGYTTAPYVSIDDSCESGSGANAFSTIDSKGGVKSIVVTSPGLNYLGPNDIGGPNPSDIVRNFNEIDLGEGTDTGTGTGPCSINPVDEDGNELIGFIQDIVILSTGVGYTKDDIIFSETCNNDIKITPNIDDDGRIVGVNILNPGTSLRVFPVLSINTENGFGAALLPVLGFNKVSEPTTETNRQLVQKVILCAEDHE